MAEPKRPTPEGPPSPCPRPAPPIAPYKPELDQVLEKGGPKRVPLPDWLKK
jgi:hypothetical protein